MKYVEPNEGLQAVVHGTDTLGFAVGKAGAHRYFAVGWQNLQFIDVLSESTAVRLEWPKSDFASIRIGSKFPQKELRTIQGTIEN